ncbi:MAG: ABC transporter permease, partial [Lachnospiraceae bacterium]|nr:ABC transporter permease [Lachnospiraceae bacterium]
MKNVSNKKIIRTLSFRTMQEKKWKNLIAISAIALTTLLFTALFTVGSSMIESMQEGIFRQIGTAAHGGYKYLAMEEYERVKAAGGYKDISYSIIAGFASDPELNSIQTEVRYSEDEDAKWSYCYPEKGRMPEEKNECAASSKVLEALGVPLQIGEKVPITITTHDKDGNEKTLEEEFVLSGFWYSNDASHAEEFWISRKWLEENIDLLEENYNKRMDEKGLYHPEGSIAASIWFDSSYNIESQMTSLSVRAGFGENEVRESVNWGYATSTVDGMTLALGIGLLGIIILSGYLIIYNIFYINVSSDIRYYGLLKTIGTTGRQLRRMVRGQALLLSAVGIPVGLLAGWFVGKQVLPFIYSAITIS